MQKTFCQAAACPVPQFPPQERGERSTLGGSSLPHSGVQTPGATPRGPQMQSASSSGDIWKGSRLCLEWGGVDFWVPRGQGDTEDDEEYGPHR